MGSAVRFVVGGVLAALAVAALATPPAGACSMPYPETAFIGTVVGKDGDQVHFRPEEVERGTPPDPVVVTYTDDADLLDVGGRYLVEAWPMRWDDPARGLQSVIRSPGTLCPGDLTRHADGTTIYSGWFAGTAARWISGASLAAVAAVGALLLVRRSRRQQTAEAGAEAVNEAANPRPG